MNNNAIQTILLDVGGVLLTNGWDHHAREKAIRLFSLEQDSLEIAKRHEYIFPLLEMGKVSLKEYIEFSFFYKKREFTQDNLLNFIYQQSQPLQNNLDFFLDLKKKNKYKIAILSNEGKELVEYRMATFPLHEIGDFFLYSCFFKLRKPDFEFYKLAISITQTPLNHILYIDDRKELIDAASMIGLKGHVFKTVKNLNFLY